MRRLLRSRRLYAILLAAGVVLLVGTAVTALVLSGRQRSAQPQTTTVPSTTTAPPPTTTAPPPTTTAPPPTTTTAPPPPPTTTTAPPPPPTTAPPPVTMSWDGAGAFVADTREVDPTWLGHELRNNGFTWLAVKLHDGMTPTPIEPTWIQRFRAASGLVVGGWGVLRTDPEGEAQLASQLVSNDGLAFYIADAEAEYKFTNGDGTSPERLGRSKRFVDAFRALQPSLPAAVSSYCNPVTQDLDWHAWVAGGFAFLPQAYVDAQGMASAPAACAAAAVHFFALSQVHPTVGSFVGTEGNPSPQDYAQLLAQAGTTGFSVYLAETQMPDEAWKAYGNAIAAGLIARAPAS